MNLNHMIVLAQHPHCRVQEQDFQLTSNSIKSPEINEVLVKNKWLSIDPYVKGRINKADSYAKNIALGEVITGQAIGHVLESNSIKFKVGDLVTGMMGWQTHALMHHENLRHITDTTMPLTCFLGAAGMPGITAWLGIHKICAPKNGEIFVVNAATGAVGSVAGQLAKQMGCRVIGIAGSAKKCEYAKSVLGFDECISHQDVNWFNYLSKLAPNGIDCLFENVGGKLFDSIIPHMNRFGRIALCGLISENDFEKTHQINLRHFLNKRLHLQAFIASDYLDEWSSIQTQLISLIKCNDLKYSESISMGIESAPSAFVGMLNGNNLGKQLVQLY